MIPFLKYRFKKWKIRNYQIPVKLRINPLVFSFCESYVNSKGFSANRYDKDYENTVMESFINHIVYDNSDYDWYSIAH